jgi:undecaprenyl pyrophosphate phosphatase UppP
MAELIPSYDQLLRLALLVAIFLASAWAFNWVFEDQISSVWAAVTGWMAELRAVLNRERSLRSLNAVMIVVTLVGLVVFGLIFGPQPDTPLFSFGKGVMWAFLLIGAGLLCLRLVRAER